METTGNPMYVWEAIAHCNMADYPRYPLPDWCLVYLTSVASMLLTLGKLENTLTYPVKASNMTDEAYSCLVDEWQSNSAISAEQAAELALKALGFTKQGKNMFFEFSKDRMEMFHAAISEVGAQVLGENPVEWIMRKRNVTKRAATDRIKRGLAMLKPQRPT